MPLTLIVSMSAAIRTKSKAGSVHVQVIEKVSQEEALEVRRRMDESYAQEIKSGKRMALSVPTVFPGLD